MKHLYDSMRLCAKEEEVKAEFCKFFKMKIFALRGIDHYTEHVLFEFKYDRNFRNTENVARALAQTMYYARILKFGAGLTKYPLPPYICVVDKNEAFFAETKDYARFYAAKSDRYDWDRAPSTPCPKLIQDILRFLTQRHRDTEKDGLLSLRGDSESRSLGGHSNISSALLDSKTPSSESKEASVPLCLCVEKTNLLYIYDLTNPAEEEQFVAKCRERLIAQMTFLELLEKKAITEDNFFDVFDYRNGLFGAYVRNGRRSSEYFLSDIEQGKSIVAQDGDGVDDGVEIAQLSDPGDGSDGGVSNSCVAVTFYFGDPSCSSSEKYWLHVCPAGGDLMAAPRAYHLVNSYYGICDTRTVNLRRGWMYEVTLTHAGTSLQSPDYDYTLACTPPDDVTLHAYVIGGGGLESDSKSLTVGQVKVEAVSEFPTNRARHVFGPLEETNLSIVPQQLFASTTMTGTIPYNGTLTRTPTNYSMRVCNRHRNFSITVNHANKETVPLPFSVIEPDRKLLVVSHGALAPDLWRLHANLSASYAGDIGVALRLEVFMKPSYVWFGRLYVEELFAPATNIWGFFADPSMFHKGDLDHGEQQGANRVINVEGPNRVGFDHPAFAMRGHVGLRAGGFKHNIPTIRYTDDYCVTNEIGTFTQQFKLEADGRLKVSKYGKWAMRALDGTAMPIIDSWE